MFNLGITIEVASGTQDQHAPLAEQAREIAEALSALVNAADRVLLWAEVGVAYDTWNRTSHALGKNPILKGQYEVELDQLRQARTAARAEKSEVQ